MKIVWRSSWRICAVASALIVCNAITIVAAAPADATNPPCYANGDGSLSCGNYAPTVVYLGLSLDDWQVDTLTSNPSWFSCWDTGEWNGSNYIWYRTYGDETGRWGWVPATAIYTPMDPFPGVRAWPNC